MTLSIKKSLSFLFLGIAGFSTLASAQSDRIYCDPDNRPLSSSCFGEGAVSEPTCGYYTENCPFKVCGKYVANGCDACSDPNVIYYISEDCNPEEVVMSCIDGICVPEFDPDQDKVLEPVCGYRRGCTSGDCSRTFDNVCKACQNADYPWYQSGVCEDDRKYCSDKSCSKASKTQQVCAYFDTADGGEDQHTTVANAGTACADPAVNFYTTGECSLPNRDDTTYCLPNNRPQACTFEYNPVCGFYLDGDGALQHKIMPTGCAACADKSVIYHQPGPCVFKCNRSPTIIFECTNTVDPVCGSYQEDGVTKQISLKNGCIGCYNIPTKIDTYTDGLCPGDEGIRCENDAAGFLIGVIDPVCGLFREGCNRNNCRQTYSESVVACSDPNVVLFKPGMCPGDEGISCAPYRNRPLPDDDGTFLSNTVYSNVCGYRRKGCTSSNCRRDYSDQYAACANANVRFFTQGPCA